MFDNATEKQIGRRAFIVNGSLLLLVSTGCKKTEVGKQPKATPKTDSSKANPPLKIGLVTDLHYADKPAKGTRHYRKTLAKLETAAHQFSQDKITLAVELGDLVDSAPSVDVELGYLKTINQKFSALCKERHYVLGNHCVDTLKKEEFLGVVEQQKSYYSFDSGGVHFIVLDSCFRSDGVPYGRNNSKWTDANIPPAELEWLQSDLQVNDKPTIVFAHQRLDVSNNHGVKNNADVRKILEASGNVMAVFQGHSHKNDLKEIGGIHYCTLVAMVEGGDMDQNGYSVLTFDHDSQSILLTGFARQLKREFKKSSRIINDVD